MTNINQTSFSAGELSPTLYGRVDFNKYHIGLAKAQNVFVDYRGGIANRAGTRYVGYTASTAKLIPFSYSNLQNYVLVFANHSMQVIMNGGLVTEPAQTITARSGNSYTVPGHGYVTSQSVMLTDQTQPSTVFVVDANTFTLLNGVTGAPTISSSPTVARIFTVVTPWAAADLSLLKFTQSFDTMTLTHPSYPPYDLTRSNHWVWSLVAITFSTQVPTPTITSIGIAVSPPPAAGASTTDGYGYKITAQIKDDESNPSDAYTVQGYNISSTPGTIYFSWTPILGATKYNVYRTQIIPGRAVDPGAPYGYLGKSTSTSFQDNNIVPDFTKTPPSHTDPFAGSNYPSVVCYFEQRKVFAASNNNPQTIWMTQPGLYKNMDVSDPVNDGDALTLTIASTKANNIKSMQPMPGGLVVLTSEGAWQVSGSGQFASVKVSDVQGRPQSHNGANDMPPIPINYEILYVQEKGSIVRAMAYQIYSNTYQTTDLTIMSNHLFDKSLKEWAYAEEPYKMIWAVREDGEMLTLTYMKDQEIVGWTHQDTTGLFKSVAVIQEGHSDTVYVVVDRPNGTFIEQFQPREFENIEDGWFLDCALDISLYEPNSDLEVSTSWTGTNVPIVANVGVFTGRVGHVVRAGGGIGTITSVIGDGSTALITWDQPMTDLIYSGTSVYQGKHQITGAWSISPKVTTISQLQHLAGMNVMVLADGRVEGPYFVGSAGTITLSAPASRVIVGLAYSSQIQSLYLEASGESIQGKRKRVFAMSVRINQSRGLKFGQVGEALSSYRILDEAPGAIVKARSGDERTIINTTYNTGGQICVQQDNPWPMSVLMLIPEISVGEG